MSEENVPVQETLPGVEMPPLPDAEQPKLLSIQVDAAAAALILDGLATLPLARSYNLFQQLKTAYEQNFGAPQ